MILPWQDPALAQRPLVGTAVGQLGGQHHPQLPSQEAQAEALGLGHPAPAAADAGGAAGSRGRGSTAAPAAAAVAAAGGWGPWQLLPVGDVRWVGGVWVGHVHAEREVGRVPRLLLLLLLLSHGGEAWVAENDILLIMRVGEVTQLVLPRGFH